MFVAGKESRLANGIAADMAAAPPQVAVEAARHGLLWRASEVLPGIQAPLVLINSYLTPTNMEAARRYGVEVVLMPGLGHFIMMEDAQAFNRLLAEAIQEFDAH